MRNGRSIHTTSALLLQLVQTSAHDVRTQSQRFSAARTQTLSMQTSQLNMPGDGLGILSLIDKEVRQLRHGVDRMLRTLE